MDFMKVFDQTVRDLKREVNLKVLKVPEIEQKVLDATSNEAWGPHGSALSELAQSTKKFTECQMIMNVLWTRLTDTGANWRHVYKALAVIEYLVANGSERAVDDILEHTFQISSLSGFEYVEPNGKDVGINVRKKAETILALLNDKEKIQAARNKAAANRDKYFGLSSTGITYKSSSASYSSGSSYNGNRYGGFGSSKEGDSFKDSYKDSEHESKWNQVNRDGRNKSKENLSDENEENKLKKGVSHHAEAKPGPVPSSKSPSTQPVSNADDFDDFDPRGSSTAGSANTSSNQVDLFGESLFGDLMDAPAPIPTETTITNNAVAPEVDLFADAAFISAPPQAEGQTGTETTVTNNAVAPEVDLFADATFISAPPQAEGQTGSHTQGNIGFFTSEPAFPSSVAPNVDLFAATDTSLPPEMKSHDSEPSNTNAFDPFAAIPLNNFEGSDLFGSLTSHTEPATSEYSQNKGNNSLNQTSSTASKPTPKKDSFQVKSGIWADSLSRGLIDLNISAPKKANLADLGIVGGLSDGSDEKDKGTPPSFYMGRAMGAGTGLGMSGFPSYPTTMGGSGSFSNLGQQQYGSFK